MALVRPAFLFGILKDNSGRTSLYWKYTACGQHVVLKNCSQLPM
jgi:hypothetical protein